MYMMGGEGSNVGEGLIDRAEAQAWMGNEPALQREVPAQAVL